MNPILDHSINPTMADTAIECIKDHSDKNVIPLIFVHGLGSSKETWSSVIEKLKDKYDIYAVDLLGHGDRPLGSNQITSQSLLKDLTKFVEQKKFQKIILI